ncbi:hypothetical protein [Coxiella endosymbiont of Ornithodoros maritimus]|uniref:hypothetical protein n=1 Tax=Coxiella endosymbiont of Ornithodoros maritimus TaxID=1656172 RepID=UPI0022648F5E|nr:hypothetical protein [Coxiella endosymbiont of Ornithodoros maritimus]
MGQKPTAYLNEQLESPTAIMQAALQKESSQPLGVVIPLLSAFKKKKSLSRLNELSTTDRDLFFSQLDLDCWQQLT